MRVVGNITLTLAVLLISEMAAVAQAPPPPDQPAQQPQQPREFGRGGRFRGGPNIGFTTLDLNGDGILDAEEIEAAPTSLAKLDKDADGQITADEIRLSLPPRREMDGPDGPPGRREGRGRGPGGPERDGEPQTNFADEMVKTLMAFDANGDGKLTRAELPDRFQGIFDRGDENKDGFLTPDEIRKVAAAQAPPPESAGRAGRDGGRQDGDRGPDGPRREFNFIRMDPILSAIDTNGDGVLSAKEIRNAAKAIWKLDKDGDGKVTREEARPAENRFEPRGDR